MTDLEMWGVDFINNLPDEAPLYPVQDAMLWIADRYPELSAIQMEWVEEFLDENIDE